MTQNEDQPLRGDAKWAEEKRLVGERNEAAYARGRADREARNDAARDMERDADRRDREQLPTQPEPL